MLCPVCGTPMNKHAEKPLKTGAPQESPWFDPDLEGVLFAIHCCPACGKVESELLKQL